MLLQNFHERQRCVKHENLWEHAILYFAPTPQSAWTSGTVPLTAAPFYSFPGITAIYHVPCTIEHVKHEAEILDFFKKFSESGPPVLGMRTLVRWTIRDALHTRAPLWKTVQITLKSYTHTLTPEKVQIDFFTGECV